MSSPVGEYRTIVMDSGSGEYVNRLLVGTATTGLVRIEWHQSRTGQLIPCNWSMVTLLQYIDSFIPLRYQVADAQNLIVREAIEKEFEWLLLWEHDTIPPADAFVQLNRYIRDERVPIVSGLYFSRSYPAEPLVYRGRGTSFYTRWRLGDQVWCDGVPTGFLLVHVPILRVMWDEAEEYSISYGGGTQTVRRVFRQPGAQWTDPETHSTFSVTGTSDLDWCSRVIEGDYIRRAGWLEFWAHLDDRRYPFLVDTNILCRHIDPDGTQYPKPEELAPWAQEPPPSTLGMSVSDEIKLEDRPYG